MYGTIDEFGGNGTELRMATESSTRSCAYGEEIRPVLEVIRDGMGSRSGLKRRARSMP